MAFPRLIPLALEAVPAGQLEPAAGARPVMSAFMQAKLRPRFLLTCAVATHCPRFLNPEQALCAVMPVSVWIFPASAVFLVSSWFMVMPCVEVDIFGVVGLMRCEPPCPIAGFMPLPAPAGRPCWANAAAPHNITA